MRAGERYSRLFFRDSGLTRPRGKKRVSDRGPDCPDKRCFVAGRKEKPVFAGEGIVSGFLPHCSGRPPPARQSTTASLTALGLLSARWEQGNCRCR